MIKAINNHERRRSLFGIALYTIIVALPMVIAKHRSNTSVGIAVGVAWGQGLLLALNNEILNFELRADEDREE